MSGPRPPCPRALRRAADGCRSGPRQRCRRRARVPRAPRPNRDCARRTIAAAVRPSAAGSRSARVNASPSKRSSMPGRSASGACAISVSVSRRRHGATGLGAHRRAPRAADQTRSAQLGPDDEQHQHAHHRIPDVGDGLGDAFAGLELPAPFLERAHVIVVLALLELVLEPALEALPARRALLALLAELCEYRVELFAGRRIA